MRVKVARVREMRDLDRRTTAEFGVPEILLMESAADAACEVLRSAFASPMGPVVVVCGPGNNGGDGLAVARKLHAAGARVRLCVAADPDRYRGAAAANHELASRLPLERVDAGELPRELTRAAVAVDALLGTGLDRAPSGVVERAVVALRDWGGPVLSLDIPSGVAGDSGAVPGAAVVARATVTFGTAKVGNLLPPGSRLGGALSVASISIPPALRDTLPCELAPLPEPPPGAAEALGGAARAASSPWPPDTATTVVIDAASLDRLGAGRWPEAAVDPVGAALGAAADGGRVVLLALPRAVVALPDGTALLSRSGAWGLSADPLLVSAALSALARAGLPPAAAAVAAAFVIGAAADLAAGPAGHAAGSLAADVAASAADVAAVLPDAARLWVNGALAERYVLPACL